MQRTDAIWAMDLLGIAPTLVIPVPSIAALVLSIPVPIIANPWLNPWMIHGFTVRCFVSA